MAATAVFAFALLRAAAGQTPAPQQPDQPAPVTPAATDAPQSTPASPAQPSPAAAQQAAPSAAAAQAAAVTTPASATQPPEASKEEAKDDGKSGAITEDEVKQLVMGKTLYLRDGYLDSSLSFDEHGKLIGHSPQGSYTLSLVQIDKVRLSKHKVELTGARYGLHFLGARADEDPTKAVDKVRITPKKKVLKITIDRELVVTPKKKKKSEKASSAPADKNGTPAESATTGSAGAAAAGSGETASSAAPATENSDEEDAKREMNAASEGDRPADAASVTTTTSPAHAARLLRQAIDRIFAPGLDDRMIAAMPDLWKLYYQAVAKQADYRPSDPGIYRQATVDQKAKLLSTFEPPSNAFAQASGVAGMALYHAVIGADGKPQEIVVGRPIGFGLDESAADTIRKASFQPAMKDGKPVPVVLDLVVQFRIYSKRTDQAAKPDDEATNSSPKLPGPYSVAHQ
ncbi:MAG TPA: energy transducer TonB [Terracidiphilus sp.]|nr:energy transducer TonB [Terracidiphilus sp.]